METRPKFLYGVLAFISGTMRFSNENGQLQDSPSATPSAGPLEGPPGLLTELFSDRY